MNEICSEIIHKIDYYMTKSIFQHMFYCKINFLCIYFSFVLILRYYEIWTIKLATKFLHFLHKFSFYFSIWTIKRAFRYICTITIDDSSPMLWQRENPAFVQILELLTKEVDKINFHVVLIVELFLTKLGRKRTEQTVVRWSQIRRIRWMSNGNPSELQ